MTASLSGGVTCLSCSGLTATTRIDGCDDRLKLRGNDIFGTLIEPCAGSGGGLIRWFFDSSGDDGAGIAREIA